MVYRRAVAVGPGVAGGGVSPNPRVMLTGMAEPEEFDDFEGDGPDDTETLNAYADMLVEAVVAFGLTPRETGTKAE